MIPKVSMWIKKKAWRRNVSHALLTLLVLFCASGVAVAVTDLGLVSDLFGAVAASSLAYIIPPALYLKLEFTCGCGAGKENVEHVHPDRPVGMMKMVIGALCVFVLCLGVFIFVSAVVSVFMNV